MNEAERPKARWLQQLDRIEAKLDALIKALAEDEEELPPQGLDGQVHEVTKHDSRGL